MEGRITPLVIYRAVEAYCRGIGIQGLAPFSEQESEWHGIATFATSLIGADYQYNDPSPFKVVAAVGLAVAKLATIPTNVPDFVFSSQGIESIDDFNCPRLLPSLAAVRVGLQLLHNAEVGPFDPTTGEGRRLENEITISQHFLKDFAHAMSKACRAENPQISSIALIFESLAYKSNQWAEDDDC
jgi:hypothetical protein